MKISKKSWHYRLHNATGIIPRNLCWYFWKTVLLAALLVLFGWMIAIIVGIVWVVAKAQSKWEEWFPYKYEVYVEKEPGLVRAWLKAKKDKVCPTLEFVNPEPKK